MSLKLFSFLLLISFAPLKAHAMFYPNDSSWQKVLECQHIQKDKVRIFRKGDYVIITRRNYRRKTKGRIQGFLDNEIVVKGQRIDIKDIKKIRKRSFWLGMMRFLWISLMITLILFILLGKIVLAYLPFSLVSAFIIYFFFQMLFYLCLALLIAILFFIIIDFFIKKRKTTSLYNYRAKVKTRLIKNK